MTAESAQEYEPGGAPLYAGGGAEETMSSAIPLIHEAIGRRPGDPAVVDDARTVTWGELDDRVNRFGRGAEALGAEPGRHVVLVATNRAEFLEALIGLMRAGLVVTPIKTNWTAEEIGYVLDDADSALVVTDVDAARAAARQRGLPCVDLDDDVAGWLDAQPGEALPADRAGWRMSYTSGTTGRPKGVVRAGAGETPYLEAFAASAQVARMLHLPDDGPHLVVAQLFHGAPLAFALGALAAGAPLHVMPRWEAEDGLRRLEHVASTCMVPTMFRQLLTLPSEVRERFDPSGLRTVLHGGEPCPPDTKRRMIEWWGPVFVEYYGFSEGGMTVATTEEWLARPGTVGRATRNQRTVILDDDGNELPPGTEGRVYFTAPDGRRFSYLHDPEKTERAHAPGDAYTAGDLGWVDEDGYLFLSGRDADVIVSAGVNVYPAEVEAVLYEVAGVADACVVGAPDEMRGETPVAFVRVADTADPDEVLAAVERSVEGRLAGYKRPRRIEPVDEVPRDPTGKVLRHQLRAPLWSQAGGLATGAQASG